MDSPETVKVTCTTTITTSTAAAAATSDSAPGQDSPIFGYISNLSPIKPVTSAPVPLGFPGLNSPPIVFTSPRINTIQEQSYPKRLQYTRSSSADLYHQNDRCKKVSAGPYSHTKKESDNKCSKQDQSSSLSGSVDQYLSSAVEVECADSAHSDALCLKHSDDGAQSLNDFTDSKDSISRHDNKIEERKDSENDPQGSSIEETKTVDIESYHGRDEMPSNVYPKVERNLSVGHAYEEQHCEPVVQHVGAANEDELAVKSQLLRESLQIFQAHEDGRETTAEVTTEPVDNVILIDSKASQHHRGMRRRCLQFEEAQQHNILVNRSGSWNPSNSATSSKSPASQPSPTDSEVLESSCAERSSISGPGQLVNLNPPNITVSKPSGIGLHLNSIINSVPLACGATASMKSAERGYVSIQGKKFVSVTGSSNFSNVIAKISTRTEDGNRETRASTTASSLSPHIVKPLYTPVLLKPAVPRATPCDKRKSNSESSDTVEELNHLNPKKKRKKASNSSDDGCKRCNCKKTKCLKLYCDCFAAGIYCAETCACQGCFNRPEYEDTVLGTRQQIESRNPLAFAPKIEDGNRSTPTSARHKRGCNCKKSMCLKKYCECYQANVGCADGCRCEGCQNVYGRKEEYGMTKDVKNQQPLNERLEGSFDEKLEIVATTNGFSDFGHSHNLTPLTPSLQCSDLGKNSSKSCFLSRRYIPSPESDLALLPPYGKSPRSPRNSDNHQEMDCNNAETFDEFSPRYDGRDIHNPGTLHDPTLMTMVSSNSPDTREWTNVSRTQFGPGNSRLPSASSLRWRSSPITPMTQFGGPEILQVLDSENSLYDILEDDTPEILKDDSTPLNTVKVSSPNKKRVSPPHSRLHEVGFSSSVGMRSGRKFILQAVPSFPPLTPCVDSNDRTNQNINDPEDCSSNK